MIKFALLVIEDNGTACAPQLARLRAACARAGVAEQTVSDLTALPAGLSADAVVIVAGSPTGEQLADVCQRLSARGNAPIVATDAIDQSKEGVADKLFELYEQLYQLSPTAAIASLVKGKTAFHYAFPKADSTATVCVLFPGLDRTLVIERLHDPFKGKDSFPGGFLNIQLEDLPSCAARELKEEVSLEVDPSDLHLVDVRSEPSRDERGHVIDHGYLWLVPADRESDVLAAMKAGDDAGSVRVESVSKLLAQEMAFDHKKLLVRALKLAATLDDNEEQ